MSRYSTSALSQSAKSPSIVAAPIAGQLRDGPNALVAPDVLGHLHVVVVGVSALHRLDAAVELGVVLVDEEVRGVAAHEVGRSALRAGWYLPAVHSFQSLM